MLGREMITDPLRWQLVMELSDKALEVVAVPPPDHSEPMIYERIGLGDDPGPVSERVKNAVYDNPLLLGDFGRVTVLYDTPRFMCLPDVVAGAGNGIAEMAFRRVFPPDGAYGKGEVMVQEVRDMRMALAFEIPADTASFLRRTFPCVEISHPLVPLCGYFRSKHMAGGYGKMMVNLGSGRLDIVVLGTGAPLLVNSYRFREPMDAVYYIMAARKTLKLAETDEIIIGGDRLLRAQVAPVLRRYVRYVMPAIFPSVMLRAGRASLVAPFEAVLVPLVGTVRKQALK
ncbi:MAG: DUF3822 family protein [Muribaculaceae bacterium]|nr:DUF3822 family protein [Muribaculaceae bacterium]